MMKEMGRMYMIKGRGQGRKEINVITKIYMIKKGTSQKWKKLGSSALHALASTFVKIPTIAFVYIYAVRACQADVPTLKTQPSE